VRQLLLARSVAVVWLVATMVATPAGAECIRTDVGYAKRTADVVVEGTVTSHVVVASGHTIMAVKVHRLWKGAASDETTFAYLGTAEGPRLTLGDRRVLFGTKHTAQQRRALGIPDSAPPSFELPACVGAMLPDRDVLSVLGRPRGVP